MLDRLTDVLATYGAIVLLLFLIAQFGRDTGSAKVKDNFHSFLVGWTAITGIPGAIYVLTGLVPG